jgi:hypothetical protein
MFEALAPCCAIADAAKTVKARIASSLIENPLRVIENPLHRVHESYRTRLSGTLIAVKRALARPGEIGLFTHSGDSR